MGNIETECLTKAETKLTYSAVSFLSGCFDREYPILLVGCKKCSRKGPVVIAAKHVNFLILISIPLHYWTFSFYPSFPMRSVGKFDRTLGLLGALKLYRPRDVGESWFTNTTSPKKITQIPWLSVDEFSRRGHNIIFPEAARNLE